MHAWAIVDPNLCRLYGSTRPHWATSLRLRDTYMRQWTRPSLVHIIACRLPPWTNNKSLITGSSLDSSARVTDPVTFWYVAWTVQYYLHNAEDGAPGKPWPHQVSVEAVVPQHSALGISPLNAVLAHGAAARPTLSSCQTVLAWNRSMRHWVISLFHLPINAILDDINSLDPRRFELVFLM